MQNTINYIKQSIKDYEQFNTEVIKQLEQYKELSEPSYSIFKSNYAKLIWETEDSLTEFVFELVNSKVELTTIYRNKLSE